MTGFDILKQTVQADPGMAVKEVFFTSKGKDIYAITPEWPVGVLRVKDFMENTGSGTPKVVFLLTNEELSYTWEGTDLLISMPDCDLKTQGNQVAYAFKISY